MFLFRARSTPGHEMNGKSATETAMSRKPFRFLNPRSTEAVPSGGLASSHDFIMKGCVIVRAVRTNGIMPGSRKLSTGGVARAADSIQVSR